VAARGIKSSVALHVGAAPPRPSSATLYARGGQLPASAGKARRAGLRAAGPWDSSHRRLPTRQAWLLARLSRAPERSVLLYVSTGAERKRSQKPRSAGVLTRCDESSGPVPPKSAAPRPQGGHTRPRAQHRHVPTHGIAPAPARTRHQWLEARACFVEYFDKWKRPSRAAPARAKLPRLKSRPFPAATQKT